MLFRSGGVAYVLDVAGDFERRCNREMVDLEPLIEPDDVNIVRVAIVKHATLTGSRYAEGLLADWHGLQRRIVKVMPREYKRALAAEARRKAEAHADRQAVVAAVQVQTIEISGAGTVHG